MTDIVNLGLRVDSNGFVRAKRDMDGFRASANAATQQTGAMETKITSASRVASAFGATLGLLSVSLVTTGIVKYADAWTNVENRLKLVTGSTEELASVTDGVVNVALRSNAALEETASLYSTLARYAGELVDGESELLRITETLNKSFAVSGAGAAEQAGAIRQLSQALASGALRGDEFNSINENAPRIMDGVAKSLNMTKGELRDFAAEGGITAEIVINAVRGMSDEIDADFSSMDRTMAQFWQNATTNITQFVGSSDAVQGVVQVFGRGLVLVSENLDLMADGALALAVVMGARLTPALVANTAALVANAAAMTAGATAAGVLRGAMALLGGPAGVALAAAGLLYFIRQAEDAEEKSARLGAEVDSLVGSFSGLSVLNIDLKIAEQVQQLEALSDQLSSLKPPTLSGSGYDDDGSMAVYLVLQKQYREEVERINSSMEDAAKKAAALARARENLTTATDREKDAAKALVEEGYQKVIDSLKDELKFVTMSAKQKEVYQAIQKAGVALGSAEAAVIENLISQRYEEVEALDEYAASMENAKEQLAEMFELETERSKATSGILINIQALSREYNALQQGTEAHKAVSRELAIEAAMREAVAQGIIQEADPAYRQLIETQYDLQEAVSGFTEEADPFADSWQAALERVDSAFVDLWKSAFTGFENFADTLKNAFIQLLAELAHRATTQKIMVSLGMGDAGVGGDMLSKIPGFSSLTKNTGIDNILKGFGKGEGGFDKTALLDGFKQMGLTIAASWTGGKIGTAIGEGLFDKQAESNIGQTIGSTIGAIWGAPGAFIGSSIGSLVDTMTGGDGYKRQNAGFLVGNTPGAKSDYTFAVEDFASGLKVTGMARREEEKVARDLIETFRQMDSYIVDTVKSLGGLIKVTSLDGLNQEATPGSSGTFLGLGRDADLPAQMKYFIDQLADSITGLDQSLIDAVKSASSAEEALAVLGDASRLMSIQVATLGMDAVEQARKEFAQQTTLTSIYEESTNALRGLMGAYDGSIDKTEQLVKAMISQQESVYNLAMAYLNAQSSVDMLFGGLSESIRQSLMSEEELYNYRKKQIEALTGSLETMTDPNKILESVDSIQRQVSELWGSLGEEQRKVMGDELLGFIDEAQRIAQDRLSGGLSGLDTSQADINLAIQQGIETSAQQLQLASGTILQAAQIFLQGANMTRSAPGVMPGYEANA